MTALREEIRQTRPFQSLEEEALLNLMRTSDRVERSFQRQMKAHGLTGPQYNVLRILRGSHPRGLTCSEIGDSMLTADPDVTRLLNRLHQHKLVKRQRDRTDRRVVCTNITPRGLAVLEVLDPIVNQAPKEMLRHMTEPELKEFVRLLEKARANLPG